MDNTPDTIEFNEVPIIPENVWMTAKLTKVYLKESNSVGRKYITLQLEVAGGVIHHNIYASHLRDKPDTVKYFHRNQIEVCRWFGIAPPQGNTFPNLGKFCIGKKIKVKVRITQRYYEIIEGEPA